MEQTEQAQNTQQDAKVQETKVFCPCCGERTFNKHTKLDTELVDHYLACLMTGTQFWKDYMLYDGKIRIRAVIPSYKRVRELDMLLQQLRAGLSPQQLKETTAMLQQLQFVLRRLLSIQQIQITDPSGSGNKVIKRTCEIVMQALSRGVSQVPDLARLKQVLETAYAYVRDSHTGVGLPFALLSSVADAHILIHNTIVSAGLDENFWQGIKLT